MPVFPFGYDWRQPLEQSEALLAAFVAEVIDRTKLLRHYADDGYGDRPVVNLVAHSMGGLIVAGYLASAKGKAPVAKVATLASPFRGSFEAVIKTLTGTAGLGLSTPSSREREAAHVTPGLYYLLPTVERGLTIDKSLKARSLFDADLWQPSIRQTIEEYVRLYAVDPGRKSDRAQQADKLFRSMLGDAAAHRRKLESLTLAKVKLTPADWLAIVGVDSKTRVKLTVGADSRGQPEFELLSTDRCNQWAAEPPTTGEDDRYLTGDGTVPFEGALPAFLPLESLVCVTPSDYGYWEIQDRLVTQVAGFHGILPNMDLIHRLIVRHFTGRPDPHGNTWGRRAPGVAQKDWDPPIKGLDDKTEQ